MAHPPFFPVRAALAALGFLAAASAHAVALDQPLPPQEFSACVQQLASQTDLAGRPLSRADFERIASTAQYDDRVRQSLLVTTTEPTFWWDELAATTDEDRVEQGRRVLARGAPVLDRIEAQFGVPREIVIAIYGIETNFGPAQGKIPVLDAALSLAADPPNRLGDGATLGRSRLQGRRASTLDDAGAAPGLRLY